MIEAVMSGAKNLLKGMGVTFRNMVSKPVTVCYPEVKRETELIEQSLLHLAESVAPPVQAMTWTYILNSIRF